MLYANLFADIDPNAKPKPKKAQQKQASRKPWDDQSDPSFYSMSLFEESECNDTKATVFYMVYNRKRGTYLTASGTRSKNRVDAKRFLTQPEADQHRESRYDWVEEDKDAKIAVYQSRHRSQLPLHRETEHAKPIDYYESFLGIAEEMRLQILAQKGYLTYASGVFLKDPYDPSKGYRIQVWDNDIEKKQHVDYKQTREDAEEVLRDYWKSKKGVDTAELVREGMPKYFLDLLEEAKEQRKFLAYSEQPRGEE